MATTYWWEIDGQKAPLADWDGSQQLALCAECDPGDTRTPYGPEVAYVKCGKLPEKFSNCRLAVPPQRVKALAAHVAVLRKREQNRLRQQRYREARAGENKIPRSYYAIEKHHDILRDTLEGLQK